MKAGVCAYSQTGKMTSPFCFQVGVQTEVEPQAGATALEDKVNAVMPLQGKDA